MPILKFKNLEDLDRLEREGKGISWQFTPDKTYIKRPLDFKSEFHFPQGCIDSKHLKRPKGGKGDGG